MKLAGKKRILLYILALAALSLVSTTFAWVMANRIVRGKDLGMAAYGTDVKIEYAVDNGNIQESDYKEFEAGTVLSLTNGIRYPGDSQKYRIRITNIGDDPAKITSFGIKAPTWEEEACNNAGYYLGTQITVELLEINGIKQTGTAQYLAAYEAENSQTLAPITDIEIWTGTTLNKGEFVELTVQFTFANKNERQNEYILFGTESVGGTCQRRLYLSFDLN